MSVESERVDSTEPSAAAVDPGRYHPESAIRSYLAATAAGAPGPQTAAMLAAAGHERWSVKTGSDPDAQGLTGQAPTATTIAQLTALAVPPVLPPDGRSDGAEKTVWQLNATLQGFESEADGDFHLVLADDQGNTMIAEIPNPVDITSPSYFAAQISSARTAFDNQFRIVENISHPAVPAVPAGPQATLGSGFRNVSVPVTVTGLGFFDFAHGQRGVAPNAIELHPVISIVFNGSG
jgi:hypothetical protein